MKSVSRNVILSKTTIIPISIFFTILPQKTTPRAPPPPPPPIRLFRGREPQDGHLGFHTAPGLTIASAYELSMLNAASMELCMATSVWFHARRGAALTLAIIASVINRRLTKCL